MVKSEEYAYGISKTPFWDWFFSPDNLRVVFKVLQYSSTLTILAIVSEDILIISIWLTQHFSHNDCFSWFPLIFKILEILFFIISCKFFFLLNPQKNCLFLMYNQFFHSLPFLLAAILQPWHSRNVWQHSAPTVTDTQ